MRDLQWIQQNLHILWSAAQRAFMVQGRGAVVVDTTSQPLPELGNPFSYLPQSELDQVSDEDLKRMLRAYNPQEEMVLVLLKEHEKMSTYRVQPHRRS